MCRRCLQRLDEGWWLLPIRRRCYRDGWGCWQVEKCAIINADDDNGCETSSLFLSVES